jgi:hypothetical protein
VAAHGEFDRIGNDLTADQGGLHALVTHGDAVGDGDGAEFARGAIGVRNALLDRLGLPHQRNVARCSFVPAARHANEGLADLLTRQPHCIIIRAVRRALRPFRYVTAGKFVFADRLGIHRSNPSLRHQSCVASPDHP